MHVVIRRQPRGAEVRPAFSDPVAEAEAKADALRAENESLRAKLAEMEAMLADATAPKGKGAPPKTEQRAQR
jgi:hypothetical protein